MAHFKAEVLNAFVAEKGINSVLEFGCGDGHQLSLSQYPKYTGLDDSETAIERCRELFKADRSKSFLLYGSKEAKQIKTELSLSIDVIFHLVEDQVFEDYMKRLFAGAEKFVVIYSSNYDNSQTFHEKERAFINWIEQNEPGWKLFRKTDNPYPYDPNDPDNTSKSDFYFFEKI
ncbi:MAG: class I SAM-dependent methyltransferase [Bacteroidota bacterium]